MPRPIKRGLDSFPCDVDIFSDERIVCISGEYGVKGEIIVIRLLCAIYSNGYFAVWSERLLDKMSYQMRGVGRNLIQSVVVKLAKIGFFDLQLFESESVLTSVDIQTRYFRSIKRSRIISNNNPYLLINNPAPKAAIQQQSPQLPLSTMVEPSPFFNPTGRLSYDDEVERMKSSDLWLDNLQCSRGMTKEQLLTMLDKYLTHCKEYEPRHENLNDAKRHFLNWLYKQPKPLTDNPPEQNDYSFDGFDSID